VLALLADQVVVARSFHRRDRPGIRAALLWTRSYVIRLYQVSFQERQIDLLLEVVCNLLVLLTHYQHLHVLLGKHRITVFDGLGGAIRIDADLSVEHVRLDLAFPPTCEARVAQ